VTFRYPPVCVLALLAVISVPLSAGPDRRVQFEDAYVDADDRTGTWTIGNSRIQLSVVLGGRGSFALDGLRLADGRLVSRGAAGDALVTTNDHSGAIGSADSGFVADGTDIGQAGNSVELAVHFRAERGTLRATRHYMAFAGSPALEVWTTFETDDAERATVRDLNAFELNVPAGPIEYVTGLEAGGDQGGSFTKRGRDLGPGDVLEFGSFAASSNSFVPAFSIDNGDTVFFAGLQWSGTWRAHLERLGDNVRASVGLGSMSAWTSAGRVVDGPHAFVGAAPSAPGAATAGLTTALLASRNGRPFPQLSTYNTWFVSGTRIDDRSAADNIDQASRAGLELFQLDAGWYPQPQPESAFDFTNGLGSWEVDRSRFEHGLGGVSDYAHAQGMQFGVWIEPERVWLGTVGEAGLARESFLAKEDGAYHPGLSNEESPDGQICLGEPAAREWVLAKLEGFIDEAHPDYLKWDYNRWMICNRSDHDHPADGGNFAHVRGLYDILATLRQRHPEINIENVSGGGRRLDFGLAKLTDAAWMDDRTSPSSHVRHNLEGLSTWFPAPYLLSYVRADGEEPLTSAAEMSEAARSRLAGIFGVSIDFHAFSRSAIGALADQIGGWKSLRGERGDVVSHTLTGQAESGAPWEVLQQVSTSNGRSWLFTYDNDRADAHHVVLRQLDPEAMYEVRSTDRGSVGMFSGRSLMTNGLTLEQGATASRVFTVDPIGRASTTRRRPG
jgi:alpha-galactosidase